MLSSRRRLGRFVATAGAAAMLLSACGAPAPGARTAGSGAVNEAAGAFQPPDVTVTPADKSGPVRLNAPVNVRATGGRLESITVHQEGDPTSLPGRLSANHRTWTASDSLEPNAHYVVEVNATSPGGDRTSSRTTFTTMNADRLTTDARPGDGDTVGIGMPITLRFNADVPSQKQADFISHVAVQSVPYVAGAWHWFTNSEVHWRPKDYWPTGTKVTVSANLRGLEASDNFWGLGNWTSSFTVGEKHVSVIDPVSHLMQVYQSDQLVQNWPVSAGKPGRDTIGGTLVVPYKTPDVLMDSLSIGIPRQSPEGYYQHVLWDTAISVNGFYVHAAPWSEASQGSANVSHGCVNLSPDRAQTFYNFSQIGDIVEVKNSPRTADFGDGEGDWQIPFEQFANSGGVIAAPPAHNVPGGV
ncbi:MAG: Ig-like domain-containing protein [Candidatus Dormibacteria bacterium]